MFAHKSRFVSIHYRFFIENVEVSIFPPFQQMLRGGKLSESASRASLWPCNNESPRACVIVCCLCVTIVNCSGFEIDLLFVSRCSRCTYLICSVSYNWQIRSEIDSKLLANMVLMRIFLLTNVPWKWQLLPEFLNCPSDSSSVAGNIGWENMTLEHVNH